MPLLANYICTPYLHSIAHHWFDVHFAHVDITTQSRVDSVEYSDT